LGFDLSSCSCGASQLNVAEERYFERFLRKSGLTFHGHILDLGCGNGRFARVMARTAELVEAVDLEPSQEWEATDPRVRFSAGDAEHLAFGEGTFDMVIGVNMLHHTPNPRRAIAEMIRVCKPAGQLILVEPNRWNPLGYVHLTLMGNHQHFPTKEFAGMVYRALPDASIRQFECHCYPVPKVILRVLEAMEDALDRIPLWKHFIFYNVAVGTKRE
jgi:SAM-dependent methyltransferase